MFPEIWDYIRSNRQKISIAVACLAITVGIFILNWHRLSAWEKLPPTNGSVLFLCVLLYLFLKDTK